MPPFRPFEPGEFVDNGDGTRSTERTITWQMPDGRWVNTPTLLMNNRGEVIDLSDPSMEAQARGAAMALMRAGYEFPTFQSEPDAVETAKKRSNAGAVFTGELAAKNPFGSNALAQRAPAQNSLASILQGVPSSGPPRSLYDALKAPADRWRGGK